MYISSKANIPYKKLPHCLTEFKFKTLSKVINNL